MSNARNLARLLPNASGQLPTGNLQDSSISRNKIGYDGAILQVQQQVFNGTVAVSGNQNWVYSGVYGAITPSSSSSLVRVEFIIPVGASGYINSSMRILRSVNGGSYNEINHVKSTSGLTGRMSGQTLSMFSTGGNWSYNLQQVISFVDNPATTLPVIYRVDFGFGNESGTFFLGYNLNSSDNSFYAAVAPAAVIQLSEISNAGGSMSIDGYGS